MLFLLVLYSPLPPRAGRRCRLLLTDKPETTVDDDVDANDANDKADAVPFIVVPIEDSPTTLLLLLLLLLLLVLLPFLLIGLVVVVIIILLVDYFLSTNYNTIHPLCSHFLCICLVIIVPPILTASYNNIVADAVSRTVLYHAGSV